MESSSVKLIGVWPSPFVLRVRIALNLKSVSYEILEDTMNPKSQLLLESNPVHKKVPVLLHNGKPVCESMMIVEYIDEVWSSISILPHDPYDRATARFWAAFIDNKLFPTLLGIIKVETNEERRTVIEQTFTELALVEDALSKSSNNGDVKFFGGENIGFVDIALGGFVGWFKALAKMTSVELLDKNKFPLLASWNEAFCNHPAVKDVIPETDKLIEFSKVVQARFKAPTTST